MCNAEVERVIIPGDNTGDGIQVYQVTYQDFTVGARKIFNVYLIEAMANYVAECINKGKIGGRVET